MRLLAVVVLYHPGKDLTGNINSYLPQVDRLLLWDNTPGGGKEQLPLSGVTHPERLEYRGCGRNVGIGTALNDAVAYAREHGYTHLLTLDQDSYFLPGAFPDYMAAIRSYGEEKRVIFSVNYFIKSQQAPLYPVADRVDEVSSAMTSGTVYPVGLFEELDVFMEELFVWGIDCEYCWRAARKGVRTVCFKNILLQHDLGYQKKKHRLLGKEVFPNEYPPARTYYNVRNGMVLHRLYPESLNLKAHLILKEITGMLPKLVITDIDGVWTDGGMYYTAEGDVMKRFSVKDGWGVIFLRELDIPVAIMTGENTQIVQKRADKLKIDYCYLGVKDKVEQAEELCRELGISLSEVAFIGDDLNDLPLLRLVGYSASPSNTPEYVKREVKYVTAAHGGYGAFREFVEKLLSDNGVLEKTVGKFL